MKVIWRIAFRNLREHKLKTLIIGVIITIGIAVLVIGNSLMDTATAGIERTYINNYTGHIIIRGGHEGRVTLFGVESMDGQAVTPRIPEYDKVLEYVTSHPDVVEVSPQGTASVIVSYGEDEQFFTQLFGIDPAQYRRMFPDNLELVSGEFLKEGEEGIVLAERVANRLENESGQPITPGETVLLTGMNPEAGIKIREVTVQGIFRFRHSNPQLNFVSLIDIDNLRALSGMTVEAISEAELSDAERALLGEVNEDALFGTGDDSLFGGAIIEEVDVSEGQEGDESLFEILGDASEKETQRTVDPGAWHFLLVKLNDPSRTAKVMADFQRYFAEEGIDASVSDWLAGAGAIARMAYGVKSVFNVIVLIIAVVAVIIIMNTLVISVTERIAEIGTMRAIGAQKSFVRRMIAWETIMLSGIFGVIGIGVGALVLGILNATGIEAPNMFFRIIFGGPVLHPEISLSSIATSLVVVTVIGVVSSLYPTSIALKITPVKAMQES